MKRILKRQFRITRYIFRRETVLTPSEHVKAFLGSFLGIALIGLMNQLTNLKNVDQVFLIGSFGASAVLVYGAPESTFSRTRNLLIGHLISAFIGVVIAKIFGSEYLWLSSSLAVGISIIFMQFLKSLHPPGGATALIAVIGTEKIKALGFLYIVFPVLTGVLILYTVYLLLQTFTLTSNHKPK